MRNQKIAYLLNISWIALIFVTILLVPIALWAESSTEIRITDKSNIFIDEAPKNPGDLLLALKCFLDNPNVDSYEFAEKISGVNRKNWGPTEIIRSGTSIMYFPFGKHSPYFKDKQPSPMPYKVGSIVLDKQNHKLVLLSTKLTKVAKAFPLTPKLTKEILGQPDEVYISSPRDDFSLGRCYVKYFYFVDGYRLKLTFGTLSQLSKKIVNSREASSEVRKQYSSFTVHKDFAPIKFEIEQTKKQ